MKIRTDFVTNSSSSSFIIAMRNDCTDKEIKQYFLENYKINEQSLKYTKYETVDKFVDSIIIYYYIF